MAEVKGGARLERALKELDVRLRKKHGVRVGFLAGATYPDGTSVALVAATQNFGAPSRGIPPRPFFSNVLRDKSASWGASLVAILRAQRYDVPASLALLGEGIAGQIRTSIQELNDPPLADATIARKGFAKPLIDDSVMINSVGVEVS